MASKRKRRSGGGRKPQGPYHGKTAQLTTRITPQTKRHLHQSAIRNGLSFSQEVERRLRETLGLK